MYIRKKKTIDGIDREILRILYLLKRPVVSLDVSKIVGLSDSSVISRLYNLKNLGIIKISKFYKLRYYNRIISNKNSEVKSYRAIYWNLDIKDLNYNKELKNV